MKRRHAILPLMILGVSSAAPAHAQMFTPGDLDKMQSIIDGIEGNGSDPASICLNGRRGARATVEGCTTYITYLRGRIPMSAPGYQSRDLFLSRAYAARGSAYGELGEWKQDIADQTEILRINKNDVEALTERGRAYGLLGEWENAIADQTELVRINGKNVTALVRRGYDYEQSGNKDAAVADYRAVLELRPGNPALQNAHDGLIRLTGIAPPMPAPPAPAQPAPPPPPRIVHLSLNDAKTTIIQSTQMLRTDVNPKLQSVLGGPNRCNRGLFDQAREAGNDVPFHRTDLHKLLVDKPDAPVLQRWKAEISDYQSARREGFEIVQKIKSTCGFW